MGWPTVGDCARLGIVLDVPPDVVQEWHSYDGHDGAAPAQQYRRLADRLSPPVPERWWLITDPVLLNEIFFRESYRVIDRQLSRSQQVTRSPQTTRSPWWRFWRSEPSG